MSADENNLVERGKFFGLGLRENFAARVGDDNFAGKIFVGLGKDIANCAVNGFGLEHHTRAAAER